MSEFHFALTRITSAQVFRAAGIDRCSPVALDNLSDILIHFLSALARSATAAAQGDGREDVEFADAVLALTDRGILRPPSAGSDDSEISEFTAWLRSGLFERCAQVAHFQQRTSSALGAAQGAAIAAQQAAHDPQASAQQSTAQSTDAADWLLAFVQQQVLMGQEKKFKNTLLGDTTDEAVTIAGGPPSLDEFFAEYA